MEVKEPTDRFKATCKSILDFITEYAKADAKTRGYLSRTISLTDSISVGLWSDNKPMNGYDFILRIEFKGPEYEDMGYNSLCMKYRNGNLIYEKFYMYIPCGLEERLLIEVFKDTMADICLFQHIKFYKMLAATNRCIHISELQPTKNNSQKELLEYCVANNFTIHSKQIVFNIDQTDIDWMVSILPHFKGLVEMICNILFDYPEHSENYTYIKTAQDVIRDSHITKTCNETEEKLTSALRISVQGCFVNGGYREYQGENIAGKIMDKFYISSIYLPYKNHPLMDTRLIRYTAEFL